MTMPALGESVTEGTVTRWLKAVGDEVTADEPLLEVSTDKVDTEIPAPVSGTLLSITVNEDETVDVGAELAVIGSRRRRARPPAAAPAARASRAGRRPQAGPSSDAPAARSPRPSKAPEPAAPPPARGASPGRRPRGSRQPAPAAPASPAATAAAAYVTPLVRRLAADRGVDLSTVSGSGVGGRIRKQDVLAAAEKAAAPAPAAALRRLRAAPDAVPGRHARHLACAGAPRSCRACARSSPGAWSSRCRSAPS